MEFKGCAHRAMVKGLNFYGDLYVKNINYFSFFLISSLSVNEELWGCNAFTASRDGSKLSHYGEMETSIIGREVFKS